MIVQRSVVFVAILVLAPLGAGAQSPTAPATILSADQLRAIGDSLTPGSSRTAQLGRGSGYTYGLTHRDSSGTVEVHRDRTDVFVVEAGSAALLTGGVAEGAAESSPGEWRGGSVRGATRAAIHVGDIVVIPAGTPHQMVLGPGERISYIAVKVAVAVPSGRP